MKKLITAAILTAAALSLATAQNFPKRGLCYNSLNDAEMKSMEGGNVAWGYNWAQSPASDEEKIGPGKQMDFFPMIWGGNQDFKAMYDKAREYLQKTPGVKVLLGFNEPMMKNRYGGCDLTPKTAAKLWPYLEALADEFNLELAGPALTWGFEPLEEDGKIWGTPEAWMDEWIKQYKKKNKKREPRFDYLVLHSYMDYPQAVMWFCDKYGEMYNKPVLLTEFCAWDQDPNQQPHQSQAAQMESMTQKVEAMDNDPRVAGYCWFMSHCPTDTVPFNGMWYEKGGDGKMTELGLVYTFMSTCDKSKWHSVGEVIAATDYVASSNYDFTVGEKPESGERYMKPLSLSANSDPETKDKFPIQIGNFGTGRWTNYQIKIPEDGKYKVNIRYSTNHEMDFFIYEDGNEIYHGNLPGTEEKWTSISIPVDLTSGDHTIKLYNRGGNRLVSKMSSVQITK